MKINQLSWPCPRRTVVPFAFLLLAWSWQHARFRFRDGTAEILVYQSALVIRSFTTCTNVKMSTTIGNHITSTLILMVVLSWTQGTFLRTICHQTLIKFGSALHPCKMWPLFHPFLTTFALYFRKNWPLCHQFRLYLMSMQKLANFFQQCFNLHVPEPPEPCKTGSNLGYPISIPVSRDRTLGLRATPLLLPKEQCVGLQCRGTLSFGPVGNARL